MKLNYDEALSYINSRLRFGIKPGLERMNDLLARMGDPQKKLKCVHVAGTNGKGSASTMIAAGLIASGSKTGLYTSPYICDFRERMQINGEMISKEELADITAQVRELIDDEEQMTEFELITCIAFKWFEKSECDAVVLEVGLGGRLDATNVIDDPLCSVIMRIDYDHTAILGDTLAQIAGEKAGIIKPECPVIMFPDQPEEAAAVIEAKARELGCEFIVPDMTAVVAGEKTLSGTDVAYSGIEYRLPLLGAHQILNSITAVEAMRAIGVPDDFISFGISNSSIPARLEVVSRDPVVIIDGAHNPNGANALAQAIDDLLGGRNVYAVMGVLADKDYSVEMKALGGRFKKIFTADGFSPRALSADELCVIASEYTLTQSSRTPEKAFEAALERLSSPDDAIVVCGSLYLAGALRQYVIDRMKNFSALDIK